jgi:hypothetical protein
VSGWSGTGMSPAVFACAYKHRLIRGNPAREMRDQLPSRARRDHEPHFLTAAEVNVLAGEMPEPYDHLSLTSGGAPWWTA